MTQVKKYEEEQITQTLLSDGLHLIDIGIGFYSLRRFGMSEMHVVHSLLHFQRGAEFVHITKHRLNFKCAALLPVLKVLL